MEQLAKVYFGRIVRVDDLVVYGHSGRYAGTRVGRVYKIDGINDIRVYILEKETEWVPSKTDPNRKIQKYTGRWVKGHHAKPNGFVRISEIGINVPKLKDL